jgi:hypothetical protein
MIDGFCFLGTKGTPIAILQSMAVTSLHHPTSFV